MLLSEWLGCRSLMSCIFAHEDADKAGHNGQCTDKKGSSGISGKHWVRCNDGYDPWIVRLGSADESDTLMKTRTRRGHDRQNKVFDCYPGCARCVLLCPRLHERSTLPVRPASRFLVCFRWPFHAAFPGNSGRTIC